MNEDMFFFQRLQIREIKEESIEHSHLFKRGACNICIQALSLSRCKTQEKIFEKLN